MTRCGLLVVATCVLAVGCGDDDNTTGPSTAPMVFTATLSPASEVPPVANAESGGRGAVQITIDGSNRASFYFQLTGFPSDTRVVGAHIHPGGAGVNGPVIISTGLSAASPLLLPNPITEFSATSIAVDPSLIQGIVNNPAGYYFNVHSPLNPGGFARGQLVRTQ
jgi:hypothetical protein